MIMNSYVLSFLSDYKLKVISFLLHLHIHPHPILRSNRDFENALNKDIWKYLQTINVFGKDDGFDLFLGKSHLLAVGWEHLKEQCTLP